MIVRAVEGAITWLSGISLDELPKSLPVSIRCHSKNGILGIEPQGIVGAFPLRSGETIHIIPKIGQANFFKLLARAQGFGVNAIREFDSFVEYTEDEESGLESLLYRQLFNAADQILRLSAESSRIRTTHSQSFVRGRIMPARTAFRLSIRSATPVVCQFSERTLDTPENRILTEAIARAWLFAAETERHKFHRTYFKWMKLFPRARDISSDCLHVDQRLAKNAYGRSRDYYRNALLTARLILSEQGIGFDGKQVVVGDALLINSADVFEKFVRRTLQNIFSPQGLVVMKGASSPISLYTSGHYELIPDVVISRDAKTLLVADAKYKEPDASDHYQMHSYLRAFGSTRGLFISPSTVACPEGVREFQASSGQIVSELFLPLNDIKRAENSLSEVLARFGN